MPNEKPYVAETKLDLTPGLPLAVKVQDPQDGCTYVTSGDWWIGEDADGIRLCVDLVEEEKP